MKISIDICNNVFVISPIANGDKAFHIFMSLIYEIKDKDQIKLLNEYSSML